MFSPKIAQDFHLIRLLLGRRFSPADIPIGCRRKEESRNIDNSRIYSCACFVSSFPSFSFSILHVTLINNVDRDARPRRPRNRDPHLDGRIKKRRASRDFARDYVVTNISKFFYEAKSFCIRGINARAKRPINGLREKRKGNLRFAPD